MFWSHQKHNCEEEWILHIFYKNIHILWSFLTVYLTFYNKNWKMLLYALEILLFSILSKTFIWQNRANYVKNFKDLLSMFLTFSSIMYPYPSWQKKFLQRSYNAFEIWITSQQRCFDIIGKRVRKINSSSLLICVHMKEKTREHLRKNW